MMKKNTCILTCSLLLILTPQIKGQNKNEFERNLRSIDSTFSPFNNFDMDTIVANANSAFVDYTISHLIEKQSDKYYISNRYILPKLRYTTCDSSTIQITDTLRSGEICQLKIWTGSFQKDSNSIAEDVENETIQSVNGRIPFGGQYVLPSTEIEKMEILIDGRPVTIPEEAYSNLFEPNICEVDSFYRRIEAYTSLDGKNIYVYIYGGNAADTYFAKLIFDKGKYLTRIVADYYALSIHGSFRTGFIGF